ncbi:MAG: hypothetical protein H8E15_02150 [Planctomycetes bacterium]|nr:hypothetical protein [Planctomycetota bacterium]
MLCLLPQIALSFALDAQQPKLSPLPTEADHYQLIEITAPSDALVEAGGILPMDDNRVMTCTRRGEIWIIENAYSDQPVYKLWTDGLQEPLGLFEHDGWIYCATRGELVRIKDSDNDGRADVFETVSDDWAISGNYHEYLFGPRLDQEGNFWLTSNKPFGGQPFGAVDWRGWAFKIGKDGVTQPVCAGLRSPAGIEVSPWGDVFYTDNQGEWCGANKLSLLTPGDFHGHPHGIQSAKLPQSQVKFPGDIPDGIMMPEAAKTIPGFKLPAVWFPYDKMGRSASGIAWDQTAGTFGPFAGQVFVGDQYQASVSRVFLEQVDGTWQGACFPFRRGLISGITRIRFAPNGELLVGGTDRGWGGLGRKSAGLERIQYTGQLPFEILSMQAMPFGFRLCFTMPVDGNTAMNPKSWTMRSFTYELHSAYGSDEMDVADLEVIPSHLSEDGLQLDLHVSGLREGYVHELRAPAVRRAGNQNQPLLHDYASYTLLKIPAGQKK